MIGINYFAAGAALIAMIITGMNQHWALFIINTVFFAFNLIIILAR
jgi:hypothetical protein